MSYDRFQNKRGWVDYKKLPVGPNGRSLCRRCGVEVPKGRLTFCSPECVHEWKLRTNAAYTRFELWKRDKGVCAHCGADTDSLADALADMTGWEARELPEDERCALYESWREIWTELGGHHNESLWAADHMVPVEFGGGERGLEGYQTLCRACHDRKTAVQRAVSAMRQPSKSLALQLIRNAQRCAELFVIRADTQGQLFQESA